MNECADGRATVPVRGVRIAVRRASVSPRETPGEGRSSEISLCRFHNLDELKVY